MVVFGGRQQTGGLLTSAVRRYVFTNAGLWDSPVTDPTPGVSGSDWPDEREFPSLTDAKAGPYYLFGGKGATATLGDAWQLRRLDSDQAESYSWTQFTLSATSPSPPSRWRHVAAVTAPDGTGSVTGNMYVFGGQEVLPGNQVTTLNDFWRLEPVAGTPNWRWVNLTTQAHANGVPSTPRCGHTAVWDRKTQRMFMFGGQDANGNILNNSNLYVISFDQNGIPSCQIAQPTGTVPAPRTRHAMAANNKNGPSDGVLFGGYKLNGTTAELNNELWTFTVTTGSSPQVTWTQLTQTGAPAPRADASLIVYTEHPTSYAVVGGELASGAWGSDVWDSDVWEYRLDPPVRWVRLTQPAPALRGHCAVPEEEILTELQPEVYDPTTNLWSSFGDKKKRQSYHIMLGASDGQLYSPGPNQAGSDVTWRFSPSSGTWSQYPTTTSAILDGTANGILYRPDQILKCGGYGQVESQGFANSLPIVATPSSVVWRPTVNMMARPRIDHTLSMLPTGEVIATGGLRFGDDNDDDPEDAFPRKRPEIWDPTYSDPAQPGKLGYWYGDTLLPVGGGAQLAAEAVTRGHHSTAVLLPDGRLLSGGGWDTHPVSVQKSVDQFSPPFLFKPTAEGGGLATRPTLLGAQDHIPYAADTFQVACSDPIVEACLIRPGASTHAFNQDCRYIPLTIYRQLGHKVTLQCAGWSNAMAPPGNYLLFVLRNDNGRKVPSVARWVNVGSSLPSYATWDIVAPAAINTLAITNSSGYTHTLQWQAPSDAGDGSSLKATRYELRYRANSAMATLEDFFTYGRRVDPALLPAPATAGTSQSVTVTVPGLPPDTVYHFMMISRDGAGSDRNWSALGNEALTPTGGGGCPFVDTRTAAGWEVENSILGRSLSGAMALDGYRLRFTPEVANGRVRFRVRENEQELTTLDQLRLIAVDHAPGVRAYAVGDRVVLGSRVPASRVTTSAGVDITALVNGIGDGFNGGPGDTLLVEFGGAAATAARAFAADATTSHDPFLEGDGGKCPPDCSPLRSPDIFSVTGVDAQVLSRSGIRIQAQAAGGEWQTVATRYPREYLDEVAMDEVGHGPLRVVFVGRHAVHFLGRLVQGGGEFTARKLPLLAAAHTRFGDVAAAVDSIGNLTTELAPGDTVHLEFGWEPVAEGQVRELLLLSHGVYTANLPAKLQESPTLRFSIQPWQPNPFAGSAMLRFALPESRQVRLQVLDAQGRRVRLLANHSLPAGSHSLEWDGRNEAGARVGAGIYFYQFQAGEHRSNGRLALVP